MHKSLENEEFLRIIKAYMLNNLDIFDKLQLIKLLDVYKFNQKFALSNQNLKMILEKELEKKEE